MCYSRVEWEIVKKSIYITSNEWGCQSLKCSTAPNNLAAEYSILIGRPVIAWGIYEASSTPFRELLLPSIQPVWSFTGPHESRLCLSVCLHRLKAALFAQLNARAETFWLLFLSTPACNFATISVSLCTCMVSVWNAIIAMEHCLCYLLHIEQRDSYRTPFRAGCIATKIQCRHMLWLSCVACGHNAGRAWLLVIYAYNTFDPYWVDPWCRCLSKAFELKNHWSFKKSSWFKYACGSTSLSI